MTSPQVFEAVGGEIREPMAEISERAFDVELWSDFDGTAVEKLPWHNLRNWSKYPLREIEGYGPFVRGVLDARVEVAGVVSRRPDILPRRHATQRSIADIGLGSIFGEHNTFLAGSETTKAGILAMRSREAAVGMLDDKPHNIGRHVLGILLSEIDTAHEPIVIGAVPHRDPSVLLRKYIDATQSIVSKTEGAGMILDTPEGFGDFGGVRVSITHENGTRLDMLQLPEYSRRAGIVFGKYLREIAQR